LTIVSLFVITNGGVVSVHRIVYQYILAMDGH